MSSRLPCIHLALWVLAVAPAVGCASTYQAHGALPGTPPVPAMRVDRVTIEHAVRTGLSYVPGGTRARYVVTRNGLEDRSSDGDDFQRTVRWGLRVQGGAGIDVVDMTWSPGWAPLCMGGHPALAILLDLDAPPNHVLAPDAQVHWERPVIVRGERLLSGRFDEDRPLLSVPSVVDVRLIEREGGHAREVCVRVPVTGPKITY
jgi:hypothetical protein